MNNCLRSLAGVVAVADSFGSTSKLWCAFNGQVMSPKHQENYLPPPVQVFKITSALSRFGKRVLEVFLHFGYFFQIIRYLEAL